MEANDYRFRQLAVVLAKIHFEHPLSPSLSALCSRVAANGRGLNVYLIRGRWLVKYYFGGRQRVFGDFARDDYESAIRVADMVIGKFHAARLRNKQPLTEESFNLGMEHAKLDLGQESEVLSILDHMDASIPDQPALSRKGEIHRTLRAEFIRAQKVNEVLFGDILKKLDAIERALGPQIKIGDAGCQ